jgi:hypothetical protein
VCRTSIVIELAVAADVTPLFQIDDGRLLNQLAVWAPDAALRKQVLVGGLLVGRGGRVGVGPVSAPHDTIRVRCKQCLGQRSASLSMQDTAPHHLPSSSHS